MTDEEKETIADRLRKCAKQAGSGNALADKSGVPRRTLESYLSGRTEPKASAAAAIANAAGVRLAWLVAGDGPMLASGTSAAATPAPGGNFATIRRLAVSASAGNGSVVEEENDDGLLAFRTEWLNRRGINPRAARALTARGDSMEPTIRDGDILLVDTSIDHVIDHAIYVVVVAGLVLVKRAQLRRDGSLRLSSDNTAFEPEDIPAAETDQVHVAGRVVWFGRSI